MGSDSRQPSAISTQQTASQPQKIGARALGLVGLLGGLGGAINAWLCYAKLPVPVIGPEIAGASSPIEFSSYVVLGGAGHGALLAFVSVGLAIILWGRH